MAHDLSCHAPFNTAERVAIRPDGPASRTSTTRGNGSRSVCTAHPTTTRLSSFGSATPPTEVTVVRRGRPLIKFLSRFDYLKTSTRPSSSPA